MALHSCPICGPTGETKCEHWAAIRAISLKPEAPQRLMMNCPNCCHSIAKNGHFVPPSFRDAGFYACESVCDRCVAAQPTPEAARCRKCGSHLYQEGNGNWHHVETRRFACSGDAAPSESVAPVMEKAKQELGAWPAWRKNQEPALAEPVAPTQECKDCGKSMPRSFAVAICNGCLIESKRVAQPTPPQPMSCDRCETPICEHTAEVLARLTAENQRLTRERSEALQELEKAVWCNNLVSAILRVQVAMDFLKLASGAPQGETKS